MTIEPDVEPDRLVRDDIAVGKQTLILAGILAAFVTAGTIGIYLIVGSPDLPDQPLAARNSPLDPVAEEHGNTDLDAMTARLAQRLADNPDDSDGWILLARSYTAAGRIPDAVDAYGSLFELTGGVPAYEGEFAEILVRAANGTVTPQARDLFASVQRRLPQDPRAGYYLALAQAQAGDVEAAIRMWRALEAGAPAGAPWLPAVRQQIEETATEFRIDVAALDPVAPASDQAAGPSAADVAAARSMPADDQQEMIRTMVARLAARLEEEPGDVDGWLRLARSYAVLGETDKARDALRGALSENLTPELQARVDSMAAELNLDVFDTPAATEAGTANLPTDHETMIRQMVVNLATRLESNPDDVDGWSRLGRSYLVLNEYESARNALGRAVALEPGNLDLLTTYADIVLTAPGRIPPLPEASIKVMRQILSENPQDPQALWYVGLAAAQSGDIGAARGHWKQLLDNLDPASFTHAAVMRRYQELHATP
jgi:cytochrome c-type biogenesis protein CcmH